MKKLLILLVVLLTAVTVFAGGAKETVNEKVRRVGVSDNPRLMTEQLNLL
jgi:hypothetical protein